MSGAVDLAGAVQMCLLSKRFKVDHGDDSREILRASLLRLKNITVCVCARRVPLSRTLVGPCRPLNGHRNK